jgi:hypothetical protein
MVIVIPRNLDLEQKHKMMEILYDSYRNGMKPLLVIALDGAGGWLVCICTSSLTIWQSIAIDCTLPSISDGEDEPLLIALSPIFTMICLYQFLRRLMKTYCRQRQA